MRHADLMPACCLAPADDGLRGRLHWHFHTPYALVHKAELGDEMVGYGCGVLFPDSGWVREVFVHPVVQHEEVGRALVRDLVQQMEAQGAQRQLVIAPEPHQPLYSACGFAVDGHLLAYHDGSFLQATKDEVVNLEPEHMLAVLRLDRLATGEDRERLLREHAYLGSVYQEGTRVRGFSLPLLGHGLIVADSPEVGLELQRWLLPMQPSLRLPVGHLAAHGHLMARRYTATPAGIRMVRGERPDFRPTMIYAHP
jgi:GNAT superfamily N-acetyltransferase